jgi:Flp pilus assembly protein TadD
MPAERTQDTALLMEATRNIRAGNLDNAIVQLKELIESAPRHEVATGMLAGIYAELGMLDRASQCFRRVLDINPQNPLARFQFGLLQLQAQQPEAALTIWRMTQIKIDDYPTNFYSGLALIELGRTAEARASLDLAAQHMPANHALRPQLTELLAKLSS